MSKDIVEDPSEMGVVMSAGQGDSECKDTECKDKECNEEKCPECGEPMSQCKCAKDEKDACEKDICEKDTCEKDQVSCEDNKAQESCEPEKECNSEIDEKECNEKDQACKNTESCKEVEEKDQACKMSDDGCDCKNDDENKDDDKGNDDEHKEDECKDANCKDANCKDTQSFCQSVTIGGESYDLMGLYNKFSAMSVDYANMTEELADTKAKFEALNEKYSAIVEKFKAQEIDEYINTANSMIDDEKRLYSAEKKEEIKNIVAEKCNKSEFASIEDVKKFTISSIAMALYEQKEVAQKINEVKETKDFSVSINQEKHGNPMKKESKVKEMLDAADKLKRI